MFCSFGIVLIAAMANVPKVQRANLDTTHVDSPGSCRSP